MQPGCYRWYNYRNASLTAVTEFSMGFSFYFVSFTIFSDHLQH
uniref:Uncharacterized protein n=1 Tax=Anguilla anguilla TaxID=7936 RepID=A0A0E9RC09_ANGAN